MENLSAEVGHKMRSAVKAKLIEMGSGGSSGYIDDELPDYVMIMVANKRSKSQMTEDLGLFLADNTSEFVEWLHQVLQKLQEVAIPASAIVQKSSKRKPTSSESKRDKKKKSKRDQPNEDGSLTPPPTLGTQQQKATEVSAGTATPSITDVFAEHLIQKARTTMSLDKVKTKDESDVGKTDDFDIPTISEIAETAVISHNRRKDLSALADLQKKINQAKRQLRTFGSADESEDEDFINIKDDDDLGDAEEDSGSPRDNDATTALKLSRKTQRIPITFHEETLAAERRDQAKAIESSSESATSAQKRTVMDRLGSKQSGGNRDNIISLSANRRMEKEIYVPAFRRNEDNRHQPSRDARDSSREDRSNRDRDRNAARTNRESRDRPRESTFRDSERLAKRDYHEKPQPPAPVKHSSVSQRDLREQVREKQNKAKELESLRPARGDLLASSKKSRSIESRVFVAPPKPVYDENVVEVPVNSVVKVQPRPVVASNKQACKNLLLRAVAEARKSTASVKPRDESPKRRRPTDPLLANQPKLFSKSFRDKVKHNIVIELDTAAAGQFPEEDDSSEVEYVVDDIGCHEIEDDTEEDAMEQDDDDDEFANGANDDDPAQHDADAVDNATQFVVTLDDLESKKYAAKTNIARAAKKGRRPAAINLNGLDDPDNEDSRSSLKVNKLIIKNDTDDEEELMNEVKRSTQKSKTDVPAATTAPTTSEPAEKSSPPSSSSSRRTKRRHVSPIKFDLKTGAGVDEDKVESSNTPPKRRRGSHERSSSAPRRRSEEGTSESLKVTTKRAESSRKYDHLPSLSSAITSTTDDHHLSSALGSSARHIIKSADRCKYYPSCGKGDNCEFTHPVSNCKQFPNCKFGDQCLYFHPKCKYDLTCNRHNCNFSHSLIATGIAPPISSHVVPVTNYKSITNTPQTTMCRFYPKCTNSLCNFFHPKPCHFGRHCTNKLECNYYHADLAGSNGSLSSTAALGGSGPAKDKMKWFASSTVY